jgi:thiopeptide-type bacteriocin biosynthesis protein
MTDESDWVSAHLFHQGALDTLVLKVVDPLIAELTEAGRVRGWFFLRHWEGGLHVRLRILTGVGAEAERVRALIVERAERFFAEHPSQPWLKPEDYLGNAEKLARWEGTTEYARTLAPNDSVAFIPYRREHSQYGEGATMEAVERHFAESSRLAIDLLKAAPGRDERDTAAYSIVLLAWFLCEYTPARLLPQIAAAARPPDPPRGSPELWRAAIDKRYRDQRDRLVEIASRMRALVARADELPETGTLAIWVRSVIRLREALEAGKQDPAAVLRIVDRCAHLFCNRLGVSLTDESYLRMLAARTVGHLAGVRI